MIQASELRIGNWVINQHGEIHEISINCFQRFRHISMDGNPSNFKPIPLTEEILLKCGFAHKGGGFYIHCGSLLELCNVGNEFFVAGLKKVSLCNIYFLHQLQNLYYALTNNELNIQL